MNEYIPFVPVGIGELKEKAIDDADLQKLVLEECQRWAKHCGHFAVAKNLENYQKLLFQ